MAEPQITIATIGTPEVHENTKGTGTSAGKVVDLQTQAGQANVKLTVIRPVIALLVGFAHQFATTFLGCLTAAGFGVGIAAVANVHAPFAVVVKDCAWVALISGGYDLMKNLVAIFGELRNKYPLLTGSLG